MELPDPSITDDKVQLSAVIIVLLCLPIIVRTVVAAVF